MLYGLPVKSKYSRNLIRHCTGRDPDKLPKDGFQTALFLTGRRSGKSRIAAVIGAYSAALAGLERNMAAGEKGMVCIVSAHVSDSHTSLRIICGQSLKCRCSSKRLLQTANGTVLLSDVALKSKCSVAIIGTFVATHFWVVSWKNVLLRIGRG